MKIIFEDNKDTSSSILLSKSYYGNQIEFSGGAYNLSKYIKRYIDNEKVLVFVDVSPDNIYTVKTYSSLKEEFKSYIDNGDLLIIPIICIEYIILTSFIRYKYLDTSNNLLMQKLVMDFDYKNAQVQNEIHKKLFSTDTKNKPTLENIYKTMLKNEALKNICIRNVNTKTQQNALHGIFYTSDCKCNPRYCKLGTVTKPAIVKETIESKAEKLFTSLPLVFADKDYLEYLDELGITLKQFTVSGIIQSIKMYFGKICSELDMDNVID